MGSEIKNKVKLNYGRVFASTKELDKPEQGVIIGKVPEWISGNLFSLGPGIFDFYGGKGTTENFSVRHLLDGYAVISKFQFAKGKVIFFKKIIQSEAYKKAVECGYSIYPESHTTNSPDPSKSMFRRLLPSLVPDMSDNTSHALFCIGDTLFASNESYHLWSINPENLDTLTRYDTKLIGLHQSCAHPVQEYLSNTENGTTTKTISTYTVGCAMSALGPKYAIVKMSKSLKDHHRDNGRHCDSEEATKILKIMKQSETICKISPWSRTHSTFMHTFGMTSNYLILIEQPFVTNLTKVVTSSKTYCYSDWVEMNDMLNRFYIINKRTGVNLSLKTEILTEKQFVFSHFVNVYEDQENGVLVIDLAVYPNSNPYSFEHLNLTKIRTLGLSYLEGGACGQRFCIPLATLNEKDFKSLEEEQNLIPSCFNHFNDDSSNVSTLSAIKKGNQVILSPAQFTGKGFEWPTINKKFVGKKYKFIYGTSGLYKCDEYQHSVFKINLETNNIISYSDEYCIFGEPYFVGQPGQELEEDNGVVLVICHDIRDGYKDYLLILNAQSLVEISRVVFESHIPLSIHGLFIK